MRPYYEHGGITIYHADCRDLLPEISPARVELLLADPPYGIDLHTAYGGEESKHRLGTDHHRVTGDAEAFDPSHLLRYRRLVLWGANCYADRLPPSPYWLVWDKVTRNGLNVRISEAEFAWTNCVSRPRVFRHMWSGAYRDSERGTKLHPCQKPVALMRWVLELATKPGELVLDPYMGSGPIAQACFETGRRYIGIEIEERYAEIAAKRLSQETLPFNEALIEHEPQRARTISLPL